MQADFTSSGLSLPPFEAIGSLGGPKTTIGGGSPLIVGSKRADIL